MRINRHLWIIYLASVAVTRASFAETSARDLVERADWNAAPIQYESFMVMKNFKPGGRMTQTRDHLFRN